MHKIITSAAVAAAATALLGGTGIAAASSHAGAAKAEHFQLMSTSASSNRSSLIAYGAFTAGGVDTAGAVKTPLAMTLAVGEVADVLIIWKCSVPLATECVPAAAIPVPPSRAVAAAATAADVMILCITGSPSVAGRCRPNRHTRPGLRR